MKYEVLRLVCYLDPRCKGEGEGEGVVVRPSGSRKVESPAQSRLMTVMVHEHEQCTVHLYLLPQQFITKEEIWHIIHSLIKTSLLYQDNTEYVCTGHETSIIYILAGFVNPPSVARQSPHHMRMQYMRTSILALAAFSKTGILPSTS